MVQKELIPVVKCKWWEINFKMPQNGVFYTKDKFFAKVHHKYDGYAIDKIINGRKLKHKTAPKIHMIPQCNC